SRDSLSESGANGLRCSTVYQIARPHTTALAVVTSRWPKRNAAQMTKGAMRNVSGYEALPGVPLPKVTQVAPSSSTAKHSASNAFPSDQRTEARDCQLMIRGTMMMIPMASPCHHVHQFHSNSGPDSA